ncbi:MarR family winged helix-turn-helix transcriptional regulator [Streptomyces anulatus]
MTHSDPTARPDPWHSLHELLAAMDAEIEQVYIERGIEGVRPRFAYPLIRLAHTGPLTIRELAKSLGRSHSAISQTVAAMRNEGLVTSEPRARRPHPAHRPHRPRPVAGAVPGGGVARHPQHGRRTGQ